jgi:hypothetical protein
MLQLQVVADYFMGHYLPILQVDSLSLFFYLLLLIVAEANLPLHGGVDCCPCHLL